MPSYRLSRTEELSRRLVLDIEAPSLESAKRMFEVMCETGEFYEVAEVVGENVVENWDEISFADSDSGINRQIHLWDE